MDLEKRLEDLEIRNAHHEAAIDALTQTTLEQEKRLEIMQRTLDTLSETLRQAGLSNISDASQEPPPPHY